MPSSRTVITDPSDIPTLSDLWSENKLQKHPKPLFKPNDEINKRVSIWRGDITKLKVDMIVNAANSSLLGGGGVDGAIHSAAGPDLVEECSLFDGCDTGDTRVTGGYDLPARMVAHTVGPVYRNEKEPARALSSCYGSSLLYCKAYGGGSIAFSSISTGICEYSPAPPIQVTIRSDHKNGYPMAEAVHVATYTVRRCLEDPENDSVTRVIFVVFSEKDEKMYRQGITENFPTLDPQDSEAVNKDEAVAEEDREGGEEQENKEKK